MSNPNAARLGDDIIHTSVLADILEGAFEAAICVAVGVVVVAAAAPLAAAAATAAGVSAATVAAASAAAATCTAAGIIGGLTVSLSGAAEVVGDIARGAANFISPPFAAGENCDGLFKCADQWSACRQSCRASDDRRRKRYAGKNGGGREETAGRRGSPDVHRDESAERGGCTVQLW